MMKTLKNKVYASLLILAGIVPTIIEKDATVLIFFSTFAIPMFFAKDNWIY